VPALTDMAPTATVPPSVEEIVYKCLSKRAEDRYASMDELLAALKRAAGEAGPATGEFAASRLSLASGEIALQTGDVLSASGPSGSLPPRDIPAASGSGPIAMSIEGSTSARIPATAAAMAHPPTDLTLAEAQPKKRTGLIAAVGVIAVLGIGGAAFADLHAHRSTATPTMHAEPTPAPPTVHVALESNPTGAEVLENDQSIGHTPIRLEWTGAQGDPSRSHTFVFRLANYRDATVTLSGASLAHTATLAPLPPAVGPTPSQSNTNTPPSTSPSTPTQAEPTTHPTAPTSTAHPHPPVRPVHPTAAPHHPGTPTRPPPGYRDIDGW
jgi:serine/threonine-protein kinase